MNVLIILFSVLHLLAIKRFCLPEFHWVLLAVFVLFRFFCFWKFPFRRYPAMVVIWVTIELDFFLWLAFMPSVQKDILPLPADSISFSVVFGLAVLFIHGCICQLAKKKKSIQKKSSGAFHLGSFNTSFFAFLFIIVAFVLSSLSHVLGTTIMGVSSRRLPFKLTGLLNLSRIQGAPFLILFFTDIFYREERKGKFFFLIGFYLLWLSFEAYIRISRGVILTGILILLFWSFYACSLSIKNLFPFALVLLVAIFLHPYITQLRSSYIGTSFGQTELIKQGIEVDQSFGDSTYIVMTRVFMNGHYMAKFADHMNNSIFDNAFAECWKIGNTALYNTHVIDKIPIGETTSSGTTLYGDAYLLGGIPLALITALLFSILALKIDQSELGFIGATIVGKSYFLYRLFELVEIGFWNYFMSGIFSAWLSLISIFYFLYIMTKHFGYQIDTERDTLCVADANH